MPLTDQECLDLQLNQRETTVVLRQLTEELKSSVNRDDNRHRNIENHIIESTKILADLGAIVREMKKSLDLSTTEIIPDVQKKQAGQESTLNNHTWLLRALVGVSIVAIFGGLVANVTNCHTSQAQAATSTATTHNDLSSSYKAEPIRSIYRDLPDAALEFSDIESELILNPEADIYLHELPEDVDVFEDDYSIQIWEDNYEL